MSVLKICGSCHKEKDPAEFPKHRRMKDGLSSTCRSCNSARCRERYADRKDEYKEAAKRWKAENRDTYLATNRAASKARYAANPDKHAGYARSWVERNPEKARLMQRVSKAKSRAANPDAAREAARKWSENNPQKVRASEARRRAAKRNAVTSWDAELDNLVNLEASFLKELRAQLVGGAWHVDHIVPLAAKTACGLHNAHNLAVVPAKYNASKKNSFSESMLTGVRWL